MRRGGKGWSLKGLWEGDGCMKTALEKELIERRALPKWEKGWAGQGD